MKLKLFEVVGFFGISIFVSAFFIFLISPMFYSVLEGILWFSGAVIVMMGCCFLAAIAATKEKHNKSSEAED